MRPTKRRRIGRRELESLGLPVNASGQPTAQYPSNSDSQAPRYPRKMTTRASVDSSVVHVPAPGARSTHAAPLRPRPTLAHLPPELLTMVAQYLDLKDRLNAVWALRSIFHSDRFSLLRMEGYDLTKPDMGGYHLIDFGGKTMIHLAIQQSAPLRLVQELIKVYDANGLNINGHLPDFRLPYYPFSQHRFTYWLDLLKKGRVDIVKTIIDHGDVDGLCDGVWQFWRQWNRANDRRRQRWEDTLCLLVRHRRAAELLTFWDFQDNQFRHRRSLIRNYKNLHLVVCDKEEGSILIQAAKTNLYKLSSAVIDEAVRLNDEVLDKFLVSYRQYVLAILDADDGGPDTQEGGLRILQHYFQALIRVENSYELTRHRKGKTSESLSSGDSHPEAIRAFMLYAVLAHGKSNNRILTWLLSQPNCPRRCKSSGNAHPFTALFHNGRYSCITIEGQSDWRGRLWGTNKQWNDSKKRAGYLKNLDTLLKSGCMSLHDPITHRPSPDDLTLDSRHLPVFYQNNRKDHPSPLSYAMDHFVSVEMVMSRQGRDPMLTDMSSLYIAFHLISKGADPRQVDPGVRQKVLEVYNMPEYRAGSYLDTADFAGTTAQELCLHPNKFIRMRSGWYPTRKFTIPIYLVAHNINVLTAGKAHFLRTSPNTYG